MREISSKLSFFYKYLLVLIWLVGFGLGCHQALFNPPAFDGQWAKYFFTWLGIALCIVLVTGTIKQVILDPQGKRFLISNFRRQIVVPYDQLDDIDGATFLSPRLVWLVFKSPSDFGKKIVFLPGTRPSRGIGKHPMVMELRGLFGLDS